MNTVDHVFIAAYGDDPVIVLASQAPPAARPPVPVSSLSRKNPGPAVSTPDAAWHRLDGRHPATAPSHLRPKLAPSKPVSPPQPKVPFPIQSIQVGCFDHDAALNTGAYFAAPSVNQVPAAHIPPRAAPQATQSIPPARPVAEAQPAISPEGESEPAEAETPASEKPGSKWKPVWELDEFVWPDEVARLYGAQTDYFRYAGEKLLEASREGLKVLAAVATREKEGCTTLVACLARSVAEAGARVALLDGNLLNPELGARLGLDFSRGWQDCLDDPDLLAEAAVYSLRDAVTLFPLSVPLHVNSMDDPRVSRLLGEIARHFDLLVVDAGTMPSGDARMFPSGADCPINAVMIVRDVRRTTETETLIMATRLKSLGIDAIGIAENFAQHRVPHTAAA
jgi:Mrp family chromosome partitioning ATPase